MDHLSSSGIILYVTITISEVAGSLLEVAGISKNHIKSEKYMKLISMY